MENTTEAPLKRGAGGQVARATAGIGFLHVLRLLLGFVAQPLIANRLGILDGRLDGLVARPIVDAATKLATIEAERVALGLDVAATMAVGDGANDIPMIRAAGLGVAYHAKPKTAAAAAARIDRGDLTALLWAQGYSPARWVEA